MIEPLPVEFGPQGGAGTAAQQSLQSGSSALSPVPGAQVPSRQSQAAFDHRDGNAAGGRSPGLDSRSSLHGNKPPEVCIAGPPVDAWVAAAQKAPLFVCLASLCCNEVCVDMSTLACPTMSDIF